MSHSRSSLRRWRLGPRLSLVTLAAAALSAALHSTPLHSAPLHSARLGAVESAQVDAARAAAPLDPSERLAPRSTRLADEEDEKSDGAIATFIGFRQLASGRTLIYVELSKAVEATFGSKGKTLEYTLPQTRVTLRNNRRPLLARHFDSVVHSAQLVPQGKDLKVVIQLRQEAIPQSRTVRHARGATFEVELARPPQK